MNWNNIIFSLAILSICLIDVFLYKLGTPPLFLTIFTLIAVIEPSIVFLENISNKVNK